MAAAGQETAGARSARWWRLVVILLAVALLAYFVVMYARVAQQSTIDETRPADAIVIFGAAEYAGKPSPVFRARLEHGLELFRRKTAPIIITTGGAGGDPVYSEGQVGHDFLLAHGVAENQLIAETQGSDSEESAARVATIMRANGMRSCVAVSDGYHMFRVKRLLAAHGIAAFAAPRPELRSDWHITAILHEVTSFTLWKLGVS